MLDESGNYTLERTNTITEKRIIEKIKKIYKDGLKLLKWQEEKRENYTCETYNHQFESQRLSVLPIFCVVGVSWAITLVGTPHYTANPRS